MPFPEAVDSSMISYYKACPQKFNLSYALRWKPKGESIHLVAGGAFASGLETARRAYYDEGERNPEVYLALGAQAILRHHTIPDELIAENNQCKSTGRIIEALVKYTERYPFETDSVQPLLLGSKHAIEFTFALPLPIAHPDTGNPLLFAGRTDMLAKWKSGNWGVDEKTAKALGPTWMNQWDLRGQFMGYAYAAREFSVPLSGFVVRGVGLLKNETTFEEALVYTPDYKINRWYAETLEWIRRMIADYQASTYLHDFADSCTAYGGCPFKDPCNSRDPDELLKFDYEENTWTPLVRVKEKVNS